MKHPPLKKLNANQLSFIRQLMVHGDKIKAYRQAYPNAKSSSTSALVSKLMKNPIVAKRLEKENNKIINKTSALQVNILEKKLDSLSEMKNILVAIVNGVIKSEKPYVVNSEIKTIKIPANIPEILNTINLNVKMMKTLADGDIPPVVNIFIEPPKVDNKPL